MKKKPIYEPLALANLNRSLPTIISNRAHLRAGDTISCRVSKYTFLLFISHVTHYIIDIITNLFIETCSSYKILQLSLYNLLNPCNISWDTNIKIQNSTKSTLFYWLKKTKVSAMFTQNGCNLKIVKQSWFEIDPYYFNIFLHE